MTIQTAIQGAIAQGYDDPAGYVSLDTRKVTRALFHDFNFWQSLAKSLRRQDPHQMFADFLNHPTDTNMVGSFFASLP
jgi:hypothetical protein